MQGDGVVIDGLWKGSAATRVDDTEEVMSRTQWSKSLSKDRAMQKGEDEQNTVAGMTLVGREDVVDLGHQYSRVLIE